MNVEESYRTYPVSQLVMLKFSADENIKQLETKLLGTMLTDREKFELEAWKHIREKLMIYIKESVGV